MRKSPGFIFNFDFPSTYCAISAIAVLVANLVIRKKFKINFEDQMNKSDIIDSYSN